MPPEWSRLEVEAIVADYFEMLVLELTGQPYNKSATRRGVAKRLDGRSEGSIERKRQNISAVLREEGRPFVDGYKPLANYQGLLRDVVVDHLDIHPELEAVFESVIGATVSPTELPAVLLKEERPPERAAPQSEVREANGPVRRTARRVDYFAKSAQNRSVGLAGEEYVMAFERARLTELGESKLAKQVRHVAMEDGDGLGFDIRSFESDGRDRFIEVKTTILGKEAPFFVSRSERDVSLELGSSYQLYRVFKLRSAPSLFRVAGPLSEGFLLEPEVFRAHVG